jgi:hypothetical protein
MCDDVVKYMNKLPRSLVDAFIRWCVFDLALPVAIQKLKEFGWEHQAEQLNSATDYLQLSEIAQEISFDLSDERRLREASSDANDTWIPAWYRASRAMASFTSLARVPEFYRDFEKSIPQLTAETVITESDEAVCDRLHIKLSELCADAGIDMNALLEDTDG